MKLTDRQHQFPIPWANAPDSGTFSPIPKEDPGDGSASLTKGFPKATMTPIAAGGKPPRGDQFNGIFNQLSLSAQNNDMGIIPAWNADFSQAIGGYPLTAQVTIIQNNLPDILISTCDNNLDNPTDPHQTNWISIKKGLQPTGHYAPASAGVPIGSIMMISTENLPDGWLQLAGQTFDKTIYPELFEWLGKNTLDDYRGRFPRGGKGSSIDVPEIGVQQGDAIRNIAGYISNIARRDTPVGTGPFYWAEAYNQNMHVDSHGEEGIGAINFDASRMIPTDTENRPYAIVSNFIIKAK